LVALGLVLTPGPNMLYLVSRSLTQGRRAGLISLVETALGFLVYLVAAVLGYVGLPSDARMRRDGRLRPLSPCMESGSPSGPT
jgi:threonine/homoserine/homoserine lactone efflux protein